MGEQVSLTLTHIPHCVSRCIDKAVRVITPSGGTVFADGACYLDHVVQPNAGENKFDSLSEVDGVINIRYIPGISERETGCPDCRLEDSVADWMIAGLGSV